MAKFLSWYNDQNRQKMDASIIFGAKIQMPTFQCCLVPANIYPSKNTSTFSKLFIDGSSLCSHIEIEQRMSTVGAMTVKD